MSDILITFIIAVTAGITVHIVCKFIDKWISSHKK